MGNQQTLARGAWGRAGMRRGAQPRARSVAFFILALALVVGAALLLDERAALAQSQTSVATAVLAQEKFGCPEDPNRAFEEGGGLCVSDWFAYIPLGIASVVFVIVVDGAVFYYIYRKRQRGAQLA